MVLCEWHLGCRFLNCCVHWERCRVAWLCICNERAIGCFFLPFVSGLFIFVMFVCRDIAYIVFISFGILVYVFLGNYIHWIKLFIYVERTTKSFVTVIDYKWTVICLIYVNSSDFDDVIGIEILFFSSIYLWLSACAGLCFAIFKVVLLAVFFFFFFGFHLSWKMLLETARYPCTYSGNETKKLLRC